MYEGCTVYIGKSLVVLKRLEESICQRAVYDTSFSFQGKGRNIKQSNCCSNFVIFVFAAGELDFTIRAAFAS